MLRRTIPSIFIIMALVFLFSCSGSADKPDVPVESITLDSTEITLKAGETATLKATVSPEDATDKSLLWTSDSESITVEDGVVTVSSTATAGEYTITVTSVSNTTVKTTCTVTVEAAAAGGGGGGGGASTSAEIEIAASDISADKEYQIAADTVITLNGLTPGQVYTVYPESSQTPSAKVLSGYPVPRSSSTSLISTYGGTFIIYADETGIIQFNGAELGSSVGSFRIAKPEPIEIDLGEEMIIQEGTDRPLYTNAKGQKVYEKVYKVNLAGADALGLNLSDIAIYIVRNGRGSNISTDYGIVSNKGLDRAWGVLDLGGEASITVFQKIAIGKSNDGRYGYQMIFDTPIDLGCSGDSSIIAKSPSIYRIKPESVSDITEDLVLEITMGNGLSPNEYLLTENVMNPRTAAEGYWKEHCLIPLRHYIDVDGNEKLVYYLGKLKESIIFNFDMKNDAVSDKGALTIRAIEEADRKHMIGVNINELINPYVINLNNYKDILNKDNDFISLVFNGAEEARTGLSISAADVFPDSVDMIHFVGGPVPGIGYSQYSLFKVGDSFTFGSNRYLDRATIHIKSGWTEEGLGSINLAIGK